MMRKARILVSNITSDKLIDMGYGVKIHQIVCDHTVESSGSVRKQALMLCSLTEYDNIMKNGYYEARNLDEEGGDQDGNV